VSKENIYEPEWSAIAVEAASHFGTPIYLFSWDVLLQALRVLKSLERSVPIRHWLSMKTQPLRRLLQEWRGIGGGIEVVSEFELRAALQEGFLAEQILVNGVAKHSWLPTVSVRGLRVHFDSVDETYSLAGAASKQAWRVGIRFAVQGQFDPDEPKFKAQFGMLRNEAQLAVRKLRDAGAALESAHFHLRSNVRKANEYEMALTDLHDACSFADLQPRYVDCGGGLPCPGEDVTAEPFDFQELANVLQAGSRNFRSLEEIWLENGRFLSSRAGVLVLRVLDVKIRPECRYLICDGGKTNHALVSDWERHIISVVPERSGPLQLTTVCGPTCMAFDRLCRLDLPEDVRAGDLLLWKNAGAYHNPWETRFSYGLAPIAWIDSRGNMDLVRKRESFANWWSPQRE